MGRLNSWHTSTSTRPISRAAPHARPATCATQERDPKKRLEHLRKAAIYEEGKEKAVRALHETAVRIITTVFTDLYLPPDLSKQWARRKKNKNQHSGKRMPATLARDIASNALGALRQRLRHVVSACLSSHMSQTRTQSLLATPRRHSQAAKRPGVEAFRIHQLDTEAYTTAVCGVCARYGGPAGPVKVMHCKHCGCKTMRDAAAARKILLLGMATFGHAPTLPTQPASNGDAMRAHGTLAADPRCKSCLSVCPLDSWD